MIRGRFRHPWGVSRLIAAALSNASGFLVSGSVLQNLSEPHGWQSRPTDGSFGLPDLWDGFAIREAFRDSLRRIE
jgi:hypothetical protein